RLAFSWARAPTDPQRAGKRPAARQPPLFRGGAEVTVGGGGLPQTKPLVRGLPVVVGEAPRV
ncbi:MAG: hypothetical protein AB1700_16270, partial [Bacillota bacterium]